MFVELLQKFTLKFLKMDNLSNHVSENIHIWVMDTLEGQLSFHKFWLQGHSQGGAGDWTGTP